MSDGLRIRNAVVKRVELGYEDHNILTAWLHLDMGGTGQGFGGYGLATENACGQFVVAALTITEVREWANVSGKPVRALYLPGEYAISAVGHFLNDEWMFHGPEGWRVAIQSIVEAQAHP